MTYRFVKEIGGGGYGHVHQAYDETLDRDVAIKFIRTNAGEDDFARDQAKALSRGKSDNIVTV